MEPYQPGLTGMPVPGMPVPSLVPGSGIVKSEDRVSIETALKSHGALEVLPQLDRIQVANPLGKYSQIVFSQGKQRVEPNDLAGNISSPIPAPGRQTRWRVRARL
jgi:hypothetical protein